jgi:hypothetical protein|tara:strand:+ start:2320 stop:3000 length:681 start_codon:yes stop_codon:yes gene_type:complete
MKMLEFEQKTVPEKLKSTDPFSLARLLDEDVWFSCTPDLPKLRYDKEIPVFIWDELKSYKKMEDMEGLTNKDVTTVSYLVRTQNKHLPFLNMAPDKATRQDMLLPSNHLWNTYLKEKPFEAEPRQLTGRILHVSVRAIQALDRYYNNGSVHTRSKAHFIRNAQDKVGTSAWMYSVPTSSFTKYLPHEGTHTLVRGFEPAVCTSTDSDNFTSTHVQRNGRAYSTQGK